MKAFIDRDTLIGIIKEHTVFSKAEDVPDHLRFYQFEDGFLTWDFTMMDSVLVDVETEPLPVGVDYIKKYIKTMTLANDAVAAAMSRGCAKKKYKNMTEKELESAAMDIEINIAECNLELAKIRKYFAVNDK